MTDTRARDEAAPYYSQRSSRVVWRHMSPAVVAALVFGASGMGAASAVAYLLRSFADDAGVNRWIFVTVPGLFAMLYALVLFQDARQRVKRLSESITRGLLIALLTWLSFAALASAVWCPAKEFRSCLGHTVLASALIGGGPMLAAALVGGILSGMLILRPLAVRAAVAAPVQAAELAGGPAPAKQSNIAALTQERS